MTTTQAGPVADAPQASPPAQARRRGLGGRLLDQLERFGLVVLLIAVALFFTFLPATSAVFPTSANLRNVAANESILVVVALAALVPLVAERFDLSVGATVGLAAIVTGKLLTSGAAPTLVAILAGVLVGALVGLVNGIVIAHYNASSLVITLGMATLLQGVGSYLTGDTTLLGMPQSLLDFGNLQWLGIPRPVWLFVLLALAIAFVLGMTVFGRRLLAIGSNEAAARLVGMPVSRTVLLAFVVSGALAGVAGILVLARTGGASAGVGAGYTLPAVAAIFLGSTTIRPGRFTVAGTLVGVFFVAISVNGLTLAGAQDWVDPVFNGGAVVLAVAAAAILAKRRLGSAR
ncbi:ABC transporter permease [Nocardioides mangrovi]|uniref:ABC transporter permease n=1 Tax=Nocardioides mangrovi TaxID=2874580 RepID=A0ABS7UFA5_9ACTN|nr:ABC transporter permease [Nocardioides mangrovi]MBZ5739567.1 ABC transporter permease [Nocardioides mangrovi]